MEYKLSFLFLKNHQIQYFFFVNLNIHNLQNLKFYKIKQKIQDLKSGINNYYGTSLLTPRAPRTPRTPRTS